MSMMSMYIGTDTGTMHIAAALKKAIILINRESSTANSSKSILSFVARFSPYQTPYIILQPQYALKPCSVYNSPVGCIANQPHCITQIKPKDIADAFEKLKDVRW